MAASQSRRLPRGGRGVRAQVQDFVSIVGALVDTIMLPYSQVATGTYLSTIFRNHVGNCLGLFIWLKGYVVHSLGRIWTLSYRVLSFGFGLGILRGPGLQK